MNNFDENGMLVLRTSFPERKHHKNLMHKNLTITLTDKQRQFDEFIQSRSAGERFTLLEAKNILGFTIQHMLTKFQKEGKIQYISEGKGGKSYILILKPTKLLPSDNDHINLVSNASSH